ncbi:hypothetical protein LCGC14_0749550, partial [marine sediment metagenome]
QKTKIQGIGSELHGLYDVIHLCLYSRYITIPFKLKLSKLTGFIKAKYS